jgi:hypothetical protein
VLDFSKVGSKTPVPALKVDPEIRKRQVEAAKAEVKHYATSLKQVRTQIEGLDCRDDETAHMVTNLGNLSAKAVKDLEADRKGRVGEADGYVRDINSVYRETVQEAKKLKKACSKIVGDFQAWKTLDEKKKQKTAEEESAKLQEDIDREAKELGVESETIAPPVASPTTPAPVVAEHGAAHARKSWRWRCTNFAEVDDDNKLLNEAKINRLVKGGFRGPMSGIEIFQATSAQFRTTRTE